jgi:hypothetical protein
LDNKQLESCSWSASDFVRWWQGETIKEKIARKPVEKKMGQTGRTEVIHLDDNLIHYRTSLWERITAIVCAVTVILFVFIVVLREQPFSDPNQVILIRMILSLAIAILGAVVPGFLNVSLSGKSGKK